MSDRANPSATPMRGAEVLTITLFGDNDQIDRALTDELGCRGWRTHAVSVHIGWLTSAEYAICRLDTVSGQRALEGLTGQKQPSARVIAVCERPTDEVSSKRLHDLCEECGRHHDVSLIWHSTVGAPESDGRPPAEQLAMSVVDEVAAKVGEAGGSSFTTRYVDLR